MLWVLHMRKFIALVAAAAAFGNCGVALAEPAPEPPPVPAERCAEVVRCWTVEIDGQSIDLPECATEDGNPGSGLSCVWISPRTGIPYYLDGNSDR